MKKCFIILGFIILLTIMLTAAYKVFIADRIMDKGGMENSN